MQIIRLSILIFLLLPSIILAEEKFSFNHRGTDYYFITIPVKTPSSDALKDVKSSCKNSLDTDFQPWDHRNTLGEVVQKANIKYQHLYAAANGNNRAFWLVPRRTRNIPGNKMEANGYIACLVSKVYWDQYQPKKTAAVAKIDENPKVDTGTYGEYLSQIVPDNSLEFKNLFLGMKIPFTEDNRIPHVFLQKLGFDVSQPVMPDSGFEFAFSFGITGAGSKRPIMSKSFNKCRGNSTCVDLLNNFMSGQLFHFSIPMEKNEKIDLIINKDNILIASFYERKFGRQSGASKSVLEKNINDQFENIVSGLRVNEQVDGSTVLQKENATLDGKPIISNTLTNLIHNLFRRESKFIDSVNIQSKLAQGFVVGEYYYSFRAYNVSQLDEKKTVIYSYLTNKLWEDVAEAESKNIHKIKL